MYFFRKKAFVYFIAFTDGNRFGSGTFYFKEPLVKERFSELSKFIQDDRNLEGAVIINFIPLGRVHYDFDANKDGKP
jgi:hypothetical protein